MKQMVLSLWIGILFLTACGQITAFPSIPSATSTPSIIPTATQTAIPSATPTASITPLPTIPTFTPTFDVSTIVTVTPSSKAECPKENPSVIAKFATPNSYGSYELYSADEILDYLNSGGTSAQFPYWEKPLDLTGDGLNEIVYRGFATYTVLGCKDGQYQDLFYFVGDSGANLADVVDLNKNGVPEIVLYGVVHYGYADVFIFEWDRNKFRSLIDMGTGTLTEIIIDTVSATSPHKIPDTNADGLKEIVIVYDVNKLCGGFGDFCDGTPARAQTTILEWNGQNYTAQQINYAPPQYRFQATQDGDRQTRYGNYAESLAFYQAVIFDDRLEWWSPMQYEFVRNKYYNPNVTLSPTPTQDPSEYPRLAAYAYYRIVLLHLVQNHEPEAMTVYNTLQQKFGNDPYGHPYVEMATVFWNAYQSTHKMYDGCAAAIQYAAKHPEILIPLGSEYHGGYSHTYVPADVCPLR